MRRIALIAAASGVLCAIAVVVVVAAAPSSPDRPGTHERASGVGPVYRLTVRTEGPESTQTEWISPASGAFRIETGGRTYVYFRGNYFLRNEDGVPYLRTGSARFFGQLAVLPYALEPLRSYLTGRTSLAGRALRGAELRVAENADGKTELSVVRAGSTLFRAVVEERLSQNDVESQGLFAIADDALKNTEREVAVGAPPSLPVTAYWFGRRIAGAAAVTALERSKTRVPAERLLGVPPQAEVAVHITLYVPAAAEGRSSAIPGQPGIEGEVKVISEPIDAPHAAGAVSALNGKNGDLTYPPLPRFDVVLANGERAVVIPDRFEGAGAVRSGFYVLTDETLISVAGRFPLARIRELAGELRPIA